jgi:NTE family protein
MGYTPKEMLDLIGSKEFQQCYSGEIDEDNLYYIKQNDPTPALYTIKANIDDSTTVVQALPLSLIDPVHMNIKILELCAQATAACGENFDSLFVPFRCVASDVYHKREIVFSQGDLGNSVRASMTFPLVFRPIKINGVLAYDGGIYNNFPSDVMKSHFAPNYTIGSIVSGHKEQPSEGDIVAQVESMIMQTSDYSRATGAYMSTSADYYGNNYWWLRSPINGISLAARSVYIDGNVSSNGVYYDNIGVVPALQIWL